jgi:type VI secretion system protein ImpJ
MKNSHPEQLYVAMLRLAGSLAAFSLETSPLMLPAYDHNDLGSCFSPLDRQISALLEVAGTKQLRFSVASTRPSQYMGW